jgi:hypothetical protein
MQASDLAPHHAPDAAHLVMTLQLGPPAVGGPDRGAMIRLGALRAPAAGEESRDKSFCLPCMLPSDRNNVCAVPVLTLLQ